MTLTSKAATLRLCGDWSATTGLAHAARRLALALFHHGVEFSISDYRSGAPRLASLFPPELRPLVTTRSAALNIWALNINELHEIPEEELLGGTPQIRNIATWYWELPILPEWMLPQFDRVSEIWAPTRFVQRAMIRYTAKPVSVVPPVVPVFEAGADIKTVRQRLGLPCDRVVFLASFDFNSAVSRKNPLGVVDAFARAFPGRSPTGPLLVVKAINLEPAQPFTRLLRYAVDSVGGVLIDTNLTHGELAALFNAADVYVSLHRSEGFGLGLAESMAIGKPVIGTAYSGNLDFMSVHNSCLVGYRLREIDQADHLYNPGIEGTYVEGALWAEPDIEEAAAWMDLLASDEDRRRSIGEEAKQSIAAHFSESAVARAATHRLAQVGEDGAAEVAAVASHLGTSVRR